MKFSLLSVLALASGLLAREAQAQAIPNGDLNTWAQRGVSEAPVGWLITDDIAADQGFPIATNTVVKTAQARSGAFAAQLQTQSLALVGDVPGILTLGTVLNRNAPAPGGVAFTARAARLEFYYKLTGAQALADSAVVQMELTRSVGGVRTLVAEGRFLFRVAATAYTRVALPLTYSSGLVPDSARVQFVSGIADVIHAGTVLTIDDVVFAGTATATRDAALNAALTAAPNPSPDGRYTLTANDNTSGLLAAPLAVLDATGRVVRREVAPATAPGSNRTLDLNGLPEGIYTLQLFTDKGLVTRKLVR